MIRKLENDTPIKVQAADVSIAFEIDLDRGLRIVLRNDEDSSTLLSMDWNEFCDHVLYKKPEAIVSAMLAEYESED